MIAGVIGGVINLTANLITGNVHSFVQGAALFGVGFVGGVISLYATPIAGAAFMAGGNSIINQGFDKGFNNISWGDVGINTTVGAITGALTMGLSSAINPVASNLASNITNAPIWQNIITNSASGVVSGFGVNTGFALANGASWNDALNDGLNGAAFGLATGVISGTVAGLRQADKANRNPWTGESNKIELTKSQFGHTFDTHGEDQTNFLEYRAKGSGQAQGQFLDNQEAAKFILKNVNKASNGTIDIPIPKNLPARVILPSGEYSPATHIRLVPSGNGVKTAYPLIK